MAATNTATIEIPGSLGDLLAKELGEAAPRWIVETLVLGAWGETLLSTGAASEALGLGYFQTLALIKERGVTLKITDEDMAQDRADLETISAQLDREEREKADRAAQNDNDKENPR